MSAPDASMRDAATDSGVEIPVLGGDMKTFDEAVSMILDAGVAQLGVKNPDDPKFNQLSLAERLAVEKASQPPNSLRSTTVYDALQKASIPITKIHQIAAYRIGAWYCDRGETDLGLDVMVCEFRDDESAVKSRAELVKKKQDGREIIALKGSWVSVSVFDGPKAKPGSTEQQKKILEIVKGL